jgi:integrase
MPRSKISLGTMVENYLDVRQRLGTAESTLVGERTELRRLVRMVGDTDVATCSTPVLWAYFYGDGGLRDIHYDGHGRECQPLAASSHNISLVRVRQFFEFCVRQGVIRKNPIQKEDGFKPIPVPQKIRQQPSASTLLRMLGSTEEPMHRAYLAFAINTGMRQVDISALRIGHLDLDEGWVEAKIHKTKDADMVPITSDLDREMRTWLAAYAKNLGITLKELDPEWYLFPKRCVTLRSKGMKGQFDTDNVKAFEYMSEYPVGRTSDIVKDAMARVGLKTDGEGTHTIRRGVARALFDLLTSQGEHDASALRTVSALLHHKSTATTERYLGLTTEKARRNRVMKGKSLLTQMVKQEEAKVVDINKGARRRSRGGVEAV